MDQMKILKSLAVLSAVAVFTAAAHAQTQRQAEATMKPITFTNHALKIAANIYLPEDFREDQKYPAIVFVHPAGGV